MPKTALANSLDQPLPKGVPLVVYTDRLVLIFPGGVHVPVITEELRAARRALEVLRRRATLVAPTPEQVRIRAQQLAAAVLRRDLARRRCLDRAGVRITAAGVPELIPGRWAA